MKSELQTPSNLTPGVSNSDSDDTALKPSRRTAPGLRVENALRAGMVFLIVAMVAFLGEVFLAFDSGAWQMFVMAGIGAMLALVALLNILLIRRKRPNTGARLLIGAALLSVLAAPLFLAGFGLILGLGTTLVVLTMALQTLSQREANWILMAGVGVAMVAGAIDVAGGLNVIVPHSQLNLPIFQVMISVLGGIILLAYLVLAVRQYRAYPLSTKLILAFLVVSLVPLGLLAFLNFRHSRAVLIDEARQSLLGAVSKTVSDLDTFVNNNLDAVRTEAHLPALMSYLELQPEQRSGSPAEMAARETLSELQRKNKVFITSYALLDSQGQNVLDTVPENMGLDESGRDYFQKSIETGLPYVSPVQFVPPPNRTQSTLDDAVFVFSHPIQSDEEAFLGLLRVQYNPAILQKLIVQNNSLIDNASYPILFDENYIRLAHGAVPDLIYKSAISLSDEQVIRLQAGGQLPQQLPEDMATDLPGLASGLEDAIFNPYFETQFVSTGDQINLAAVKEMDALPWLVVFVQPRDLFLTPIQTQTRTTLFLAIAIAGVVAAAAFVMGQFLAYPLTSLTEAVTRFTDGDLQARAQINSDDESGVLAASFNTMAEQVGRLLTSLEDRTQALEAEIQERERAEADLHASEYKYRTLFEDSRDIIFITTPSGRILDINPAGVRLSGYTKEALLNINLEALYADPEDRRTFVKQLNQKGAISDFRTRFRLKNGACIDCLMTAVVRRDDTGNILGYQGIIRDITEQLHLEQERLRLSALERELAIAHEIQESLLPPPRPEWPALDVLCYSVSAREVGGDFYAYHTFDDTRYAIAVGDVSGKGTSAALLMSVSLASFQSTVRRNLAPGALLGSLDRMIATYTRGNNQNCALVYAEIAPMNNLTESNDGAGWQLLVANAGCVVPLVRRRNGVVDWVDAFGIPLGTKYGAHFGYTPVETTLEKGDMVILTSDGVVEATNWAGEMFGFERLEAAIASGSRTSAQVMSRHLQESVAGFVGDLEPHDDLTIVVVQV